MDYYENGSSGDVIGFDADVSRALAKRWGLEAKFAVSAFDGLLPGLQGKRCDVMLSGLYINETRLATFDAAAVTKTGPMIVTTTAKQNDFTKPTDLCGLSVTAQASSANAGKVKSLATDCAALGKPAPKLLEYPKVSESVLSVLNGRADALVETDVDAAYIASQNEGKLVAVRGGYPQDIKTGMYTRKGDTLTAPAAEGIKALRADGTLAKIAEQYKLDKSMVDVG
ncbi:transporter substrate-binding domain-containing protein [Arthrobacter sp. StoSoilB5]|uniref:transporter substrate-binding domain-containing protein n=1 Tax=Arthrobacter sp. StoSoilB5 TaxID=2830992 RepID=UPI001CC63169|nr:transporter substrate-binding domain-containing protein [Arthrobacter sp. StoSoilB5]BCW44855.1 hypothetical protein StoSoilB5_20390 [Arthrobacter sp. StoSoilB5]